MEAELTLGVDLSRWEENCDCDSNDGTVALLSQNEETLSSWQGKDQDDTNTVLDLSSTRQEHVSSSPLRSASDTSTATATKIESATTVNNDKEMPMIYRLMPIKLLAGLLIISSVMAVRYMVDFQRYEGIDPSDQKNVEFELLQLAGEA
jgi:hypothetical protein